MLATLIHRIARHRWPVLAAQVLLVSLAIPANFGVCAEDASSWRTGEDFRRQLESTIGFQWEKSPIREGLRGLAANQRVAIWLDRRVDPEYEVDLAVSDSTLDESLQRIGSSIGGGVSYVGSVAYLGSPSVTAKLATFAAMRRDEVKLLPTASKIRFAEENIWTWEALATPRELLSELARQANTEVVNINLIPHDLWPAGDWPAMQLTDRMTLLLAGFDLTFDIARDGTAIRLTPMPAEAVMERSYAPRGSLNSAEAAVAAAFPGVAVKKAAARLAVTGTYEEHEAIDRLLRGEPVRRVETTPGSKRFDLRVENQPIGAIIKAVADREKLLLRVEPPLQAKLQQLISLDVKQLTLDELLDSALKSTGITHRIEDDVLELRSR